MDAKDLKYFVRAGVSLIYVTALDQEVFLDWFDGNVADMIFQEKPKAEKAAKKCAVYEWSLGTGLIVRDPLAQEKSSSDQATSGIGPALAKVIGLCGAEERMIVLIRDVMQILGRGGVQSSPDLVAISKIRDIVSRTSITFIFLSNINVLPSWMEREVVVLDWPLPTMEQHRQFFQDIQEGYVSDEPDSKNKEKMKIQIDVLDEETMRDVCKAAQGLTQQEDLWAASYSIMKNKKIVPAVISEMKKQNICKSGFLEWVEQPEHIEDVGGMDELKRWLNLRRAIFTQEARDFGIDDPKGILMIGIPGVVKSLACKAIAHVWNMPLIRLDMGKLFSATVGSSEANTRNMLSTVEAVAPCVLFIDEIEKGLSGIKSSNNSDAGVTARVAATILQWLQDKKQPVFVAATANDIASLPPEMTRRGRWDEMFFTDLPNRTEREMIFRIHLRKRRRDPDALNLNFEQLTDATKGYTGAEIEQIVVISLIDAFCSKKEVTQTGLLKAVGEVTRMFDTMKESIDALKDWVAIKDGQGTRARLASTYQAEG